MLELSKETPKDILMKMGDDQEGQSTKIWSCFMSVSLKNMKCLTLTTCGVCNRLSSGALQMLFGPAHEAMDLVGVLGTFEHPGEFWEDGCTTKSKSLLTKHQLCARVAFEKYIYQ